MAKAKAAAGKGKDAGKGGDDKVGKVKGAQHVNVRHILVRTPQFFIAC